ncbi:methylated-DNA--[protein]-cysteine S-methyltransferase [Parasphingopyxis sp. GrpM-11]|uniref:Methylated-DNA--[protein]-cysteine S-methyltransferase n=2 Tax=Parasphingopyxis marina TaxID=2761622 RepID=A0A842HWG9_9SPHN|nr:methylated-DNA--[protein]-cysteine S-methyltransferase [Parasphingopyxis marina]
MTCRIIASPIGAIAISAGAEAIEQVRLLAADADPEAADHPLLDEAARQIGAYFAGRLTRFDLPLAPCSTQRGEELRAAIIAVPYGETQSYGELARRASSGPRAIGQACRRNPLPLIVPCHRVIASGGTIGYYSGGSGIDTKAALLNHEAGKEGRRWAA